MLLRQLCVTRGVDSDVARRYSRTALGQWLKSGVVTGSYTKQVAKEARITKDDLGKISPRTFSAKTSRRRDRDENSELMLPDALADNAEGDKRSTATKSRAEGLRYRVLDSEGRLLLGAYPIVSDLCDRLNALGIKTIQALRGGSFWRYVCAL